MVCKYLAVFCIVGKARCLLSWSHFPAWEKLLTDRFSLATVLYCLGRQSTVYLLSLIWLFMTPWTIAWQANGSPLQDSCLGKVVTWVKWDCFSSSVCSIWGLFFCFFFLLSWCARISLGLQNFHRGILIYGWLSKSVFLLRRMVKMPVLLFCWNHSPLSPNISIYKAL